MPVDSPSGQAREAPAADYCPRPFLQSSRDVTPPKYSNFLAPLAENGKTQSYFGNLPPQGFERSGNGTRHKGDSGLSVQQDFVINIGPPYRGNRDKASLEGSKPGSGSWGKPPPCPRPADSNGSEGSKGHRRRRSSGGGGVVKASSSMKETARWKQWLVVFILLACLVVLLYVQWFVLNKQHQQVVAEAKEDFAPTVTPQTFSISQGGQKHAFAAQLHDE